MNYIRQNKILILLIFFSLPFSVYGESFKIGEELRYEISWGIFDLGDSIMKVDSDKKGILIFSSKTRGSSLVNTFYSVKNDFISIWDTENKRVIKTVKKIHEGNFNREYTAKFDYKKSKINWIQKGCSPKITKGKEKGYFENDSTNLQDALSAIYFSRGHLDKLSSGISYQIKIFDDLKQGNLAIKYLKKEKISLEINEEEKEFDAIVVEPKFQTTGLFRWHGKMKLWVSDDDEKIPLKIRVSLWLGDIEVELNSIKKGI